MTAERRDIVGAAKGSWGQPHLSGGRNTPSKSAGTAHLSKGIDDDTENDVQNDDDDDQEKREIEQNAGAADSLGKQIAQATARAEAVQQPKGKALQKAAADSLRIGCEEWKARVLRTQWPVLGGGGDPCGTMKPAAPWKTGVESRSGPPRAPPPPRCGMQTHVPSPGPQKAEHGHTRAQKKRTFKLAPPPLAPPSPQGPNDRDICPERTCPLAIADYTTVHLWGGGRDRRGEKWDWIGLDWIGLDWIGLDWIGLDWIGLDWIGLDWIGLDWIGLDWIGLDWIGLDWIGLDWIGLDWIGLDWIGLD